ncbi:MAG: nitroreductase family protein [Nitrososphaerota archaeon]|jgi:nitroreductase|nr:nitroreductase family protein [Nitrososphaerota archaeon]MDG6932162.1 nitroreductase family protein [Nitrososphaerota archaeon]MDG6943901.1 nitroreductase family protein [Nitrososphaerota archaeon]
MDCNDAIFSRRSVRKFTSETVNDAIIQKILLAGASAPSAHNEQPWHFIALNNEEIKKRLAQEMMVAYIASGKADEQRARRSYDMTINTPAIIIGCLDTRLLKYQNELEYKMGVQSLAAAAENMLIAANCLGLGAFWRAAPWVTTGIMRGLLGIPDYVEPQWMIHLGYAAGEPREKSLRSDINHWNHW